MHPLHAITLTYLGEIQKQRAQTHSTEELSYRDYLGKFLRGIVPALGKPAAFTGEGRKITWGRPDYTVTDGLRVIGYIEAEALGVALTQLKGHAEHQNARFRENLHNFLLTNHTEFRLYRGGKEVAAAQLPEPPATGTVTVSDASLDALQGLFENFLDASTPAAVSAEDLARQLAKRARFLRVAADAMLSHDDSPLHPYWNLYRDTLFADISKEKFADVYAQTFAYGLFLAWLNTDKEPFDRETALHALPRAVPPIRVLLTFAGGDELPEAFLWTVDGLCADLDAANKATATQHTAGIQDPLIHFYEPFLAAYDPQLRERAGVYYTPDPVVDFLVRAVDDLLKRDFGKDMGLADDSVRLLDPATGTATFLARAYRQVHQTMLASGEGGLWPDRARNHVAKHFYGFERLPAAYTLAHVKLRQQMSEMGVTLGDADRLPIFLADTMMNRVPEQLALPGANILSREIREAARVRDQEEILVVLGNPPYNVKSDNPSKDSSGELTFIGDLVQTYYTVDGQPLGERNSKSLQDDYVKFIRFAQWRIERSGQGIVGFITNNSYLTEPTFRGMRRSLMKTFDDIYILDLHGNSTKRERSPDGTEDKNVFDIKQGVAIALMVRREGGGKGEAKVYHADLHGSRQGKYDALRESGLDSIQDVFSPSAPLYRFKDTAIDLLAEYSAGWSVNDVFTLSTTGFKTHRDHFAIAFDEATLEARMSDLRGSLSDDQIRERYRLPDTPDWSLADARAAIRADGQWKGKIMACAYRPFDDRLCYLNSTAMDRPRPELMLHGHPPNLMLITSRQGEAVGEDEWQVIHATRYPADTNLFRRGGNQIYPLWLFPTEQEKAFGMEQRSNLSPAFMTALQERVGDTPAPDDVFHYAYAVFHAPTYRTRYAAFLKTDFPRLSLPPDAESFQALAALGAKLTALHLLEAPELKNHGIGFPVGGDHMVKKMRREDRYVRPIDDGRLGRVRLNDTEYFENVPLAAWEFQVGGYQSAFKWLDDRKDRALSEDDITHYRRMLAAMRETAALLPQLDAAFLRLLSANETLASAAVAEENSVP